MKRSNPWSSPSHHIKRTSWPLPFHTVFACLIRDRKQKSNDKVFFSPEAVGMQVNVSGWHSITAVATFKRRKRKSPHVKDVNPWELFLPFHNGWQYRERSYRSVTHKMSISGAKAEEKCNALIHEQEAQVNVTARWKCLFSSFKPYRKILNFPSIISHSHFLFLARCFELSLIV